jgi:hypothetical protein
LLCQAQLLLVPDFYSPIYAWGYILRFGGLGTSQRGPSLPYRSSW